MPTPSDGAKKLIGDFSPKLVELTVGELREIEGAASNITVQGERYPEQLEQMSYR